IAFDHPIFAPFAAPQYSDFTKIRFWKHRKIDAPADRPSSGPGSSVGGGSVPRPEAPGDRRAEPGPTEESPVGGGSAPRSDSRVLARFDNGDPAVIEKPLDKGNLIVMTSGWSRGDSQLARSSKFVPLMMAMLDRRDPRPFDIE